MLWVTTCILISLGLLTAAYLGWRQECREEALREEGSPLAVRQNRLPQTPVLTPPRKVGFSGTLDRLKDADKRKAG